MGTAQRSQEMSTRQTFKTVVFLIVIGILGLGYLLHKHVNRTFEDELYEMGSDSDSPTSIYMFHLLEKYSEEYDIPKHILFNVAYLETGYRGPFHWNYNPYRTSVAGAQGPMQIITRWSHKYAGRRLTPKELREDLELNVSISCKMLVKLKRMYKRWDLALGYYNTGHPRVNGYANYAANTLNYKSKWIQVKKYELK